MNDLSDYHYHKSILDILQTGDAHSLSISLEAHTILSADSTISAYLGGDIYTSFTSHIHPEDREVFLSKLVSRERGWFSIRLLSGEQHHRFYLRLESIIEERFANYSLVRIQDLLKNSSQRIRLLGYYRSILGLYDDVSFVFHPESQLVELFHIDQVVFKRYSYPFLEFRELLLQASQDELQRDSILAFLDHVAEQHAFFSTTIPGNLIGKDSSIQSTLLTGRSESRNGSIIEVIGVIHPDRSGKGNLSALKRDFLTGAVQKEDITQLAALRVNEDRLDGTAIAILDIDYFKSVNDTYGHRMGDTVLRRVSEIITQELGNDGILGRIGGDEFMLVFYDVITEPMLKTHLHNIKNMVCTCFPTLGPGGSPLSVSIGCSVYPSDAGSFSDLFMVADYCLYLAKNKGRNRYIIYTKERHPSLELIRSSKMSAPRLEERPGRSPADTILDMVYEVEHHRRKPPVTKLLSSFALCFQPSNMMLFTGEQYRLLYESGSERCKEGTAGTTLSAFLQRNYPDEIDRNFLVVNRLESLPSYMKEVKDYLSAQGICSFIEFRFQDAAGSPAALLLLSTRYVQWNQLYFRYYHIFIDILKKYELDELQSLVASGLGYSVSVITESVRDTALKTSPGGT